MTSDKLDYWGEFIKRKNGDIFGNNSPSKASFYYIAFTKNWEELKEQRDLQTSQIQDIRETVKIELQDFLRKHYDIMIEYDRKRIREVNDFPLLQSHPKY